MLNRKTLVSIIAIVCCADMAFGAASLRIGGTQNATGTTARAGTLRAGSVKLADVTPKSSVSGGTATPTTIGRLATSTGGSSVGNSHGRISGHGSGASAAALDELERRVNALTDDYGRLDGQYDRLSNDVNYAATTATSANTGINNLRTRVDTVEGKITGLENQGVDTATINGLIDNKIGNFPTKNEVTTQINTASEALRDYADSTGMTETERQELTRLSSAVDTKLSISDAENTYATKTQLDNAIVGNESVLADYVQTTYANAHFATKPEVNALTTALNNKVDATYVTNKINEAQLDGGDVDLSDYYTKPETNALLANKINTETANATFETRTHAADTYANKETTENALSRLNTNMENKVTETQLNAAIAAAQLDGSDVDLSGYYNKDEADALFETQTHATDTYANKVTTENTLSKLSADVANKINTETANATFETQTHAATTYANKETTENALSQLNTNMANKVTETQLNAAIAAAQLDGGDVDLSGYYNKDEADALFETRTHAADTYANKVTTADAITLLQTASAQMNNKITDAESNIDTLEETVGSHATSIVSLGQNKLDKNDAVINKITTNETNIAALQTANTTMSNKITDAESDIDTLEETVGSHTTSIASLGQNKLDKNDAVINKITTNETNIAALQTANTTIENDIDALRTNLENKATKDEVSAVEAAAKVYADSLALSGGNLSQEEIEEMVTGIVQNNMASKADKSELETAQATLAAAIAALPNEDRVAQIAANAANAAALCAGGRIETQESTVGGKTVINVNCVTDD